MKILIVNQYTPPDTSPTACLAGDLKAWFETEGHSVQLLGAGGYRSRSHGKSRWRRELFAHGKLLWQGMASGRPDLVIVLSSPPMILVAGWLIAARHRARLVHWALDLYPDLAWALGEYVSAEGFAAFHRLMEYCLQKCSQVVAVSEEMKPYLKSHYGVESEVIEPWPQKPSVQIPASPAVAGRHWLYSGNLGRAHDYRSLLQIQRHLEDRGTDATLVFQGDGQARDRARALAEEWKLKRVVWTGYVEAEKLVSTLAQADVLVVTQKMETRGMLWPSKLALAKAICKQVLWIGPGLSGMGDKIRSFPPGQDWEAADWIQRFLEKPRPDLSSEESMSNIQKARERGQIRWLELVCN